MLTQLQRHHDALTAYEQALELAPELVQAYVYQAVTLFEIKHYQLARLSAAAAIELDTNSAVAYYNRGLAYSRLNRCQEGLRDNLRAIELQPDYADAHWNTALNCLLLGDYAAGWRHYEWRWRRTGAGPQHYAERPLWTGSESLAGKTILLHAEQGIGDTIQFSRYVPMVAARGARVLLEVYPAVAPLFTRLPGVAEILIRGEQDSTATFDYQAPLLTLPLAFGTTMESIPTDSPYLHPHPSRLRQWREILGARTHPRIGLSWSGNPSHRHDQERSIPLAQLASLLIPDGEFFSLQRDVRPEDKAVLAEHEELRHFGEQLRDFSHTAALIAHMDLVISVDTAVAHLAGAMGKPTWVLLPFHPDWRWLLERHDSPWYPSLRVFRQPLRDDWATVLQQVAQALGDALASAIRETPHD
ncbi:glycosyltransferase family 9 protein [Allochromatium palmeri]|uniref:glycosyltransferase family 9 protein n=1 Tax=Allochromatium palmeri TaxID=231048 RepID=UPI0016433938